jgi:GT2 family glycosyltransferase
MASGPDSASASLRISVVTFAPDADVLARTLASAAAAIDRAQKEGALGATDLVIVDNGPDARAGATVDAAAEALRGTAPAVPVHVLRGHGNVGYGAGHNLAIRDAASDLHLILNPDVVLAPDALAEAARYMAGHPGVALLAPRVTGDDGRLQFLCKRYPSPLILALRGFAPRPLRSLFDGALAHYEMRDVIGDEAVVDDVPIASGAFMFCRTSALAAVGGFDPRFFLYFEDFDLSLRLAPHGRIAYVPAVRIVHYGGHSARKGAAHVRMFAASALRFFRKHGWRAPAQWSSSKT